MDPTIPAMPAMRRVRVLINPRSGLHGVGFSLLRSFDRHWSAMGADLTFQLSSSIEDGRAKARRAIEEQADSIIVAGGDGMVNTIGSLLVGTRVSLGVIPLGSGNGFARHFGIPLEPDRAVRALAGAAPQTIDVGTADGRPFLVTCSMAWDAAVARAFERSPIRGILPYVMAAAYGLLEYRPQPFEVVLDGGPPQRFRNPLVFTIANLTQFGGGARIAPRACPDDGHLELVVIEERDMPGVLAKIGRLFDGTLDQLSEVRTFRFRDLLVRRERTGAIQLDGEPVEAATDTHIGILPAALRVLVPAEGEQTGVRRQNLSRR